MISFQDEAWEDYLYWREQNKPLFKRINMLIRDIQRHPFKGVGKPESLKHKLSGYWSRRINEEHRLIRLRMTISSLPNAAFTIEEHELAVSHKLCES